MAKSISSGKVSFGKRKKGKYKKTNGPKEKHSKVLKNVRILLEDGHFRPQKIDDIFSKKVLKKFLEELKKLKLR